MPNPIDVIGVVVQRSVRVGVIGASGWWVYLGQPAEKAWQEEQARQAAAAAKAQQEEKTRQAAAAAKAQQEDQARQAGAAAKAQQEDQARQAGAAAKAQQKEWARPPSASPPAVSQNASDPLDFSALYRGKINVWFSTQSQSNGVPAIIAAFHHDFPLFAINDRTVPPAGFVEGWRTESGEALPDVAFIDDYRKLRPLLDDNSIWKNWGHDRFGLNGWWVIAKRSGRLDAARAFVRWLAAPPTWHPLSVKNSNLTVQDAKTIEARALAAVEALRSGDRAGLEELLDPEAGRAGDDPTYLGLNITSAKPLQTFGNSRIAFTLVEVAGSSTAMYGVRHMSFVFREKEASWRILQMERDVILRSAQDLFSEFDKRITSDSSEIPPGKPVLTDPPDNAVLPLPPSRHPTLTWTIESAAPAFFMVETQMNDLHTDAPPSARLVR
jgi:hypothetical protein